VNVVTVRVTDDDIREGRPEDVCECPIAYGVRRVLTDYTRIEVGNDNLVIENDSYALRVSLPDEARDFIRRFDGADWYTMEDDTSAIRDKFKPFEFTIEVPTAFVRP